MEDDNSGKTDIFDEVVSFARNQPQHIISDWVEPGNITKRLSVAVLLPSGISLGYFSARVAENGCSLEITLVWLDSLANLKPLHRKWLSFKGIDRIEGYRSKLNGFGRFQKFFEHAVLTVGKRPLELICHFKFRHKFQIDVVWLGVIVPLRWFM